MYVVQLRSRMVTMMQMAEEEIQAWGKEGVRLQA